MLMLPVVLESRRRMRAERAEENRGSVDAELD
jgi:hypothetical protein